MHEYHLVQSALKSILEKVSSQEDVRRVTSVSLKVGVLKMVTPDSFREAFVQVAQGTLCAQARLAIEIVEGDTFSIEAIEVESSQ